MRPPHAARNFEECRLSSIVLTNADSTALVVLFETSEVIVPTPPLLSSRNDVVTVDAIRADCARAGYFGISSRSMHARLAELSESCATATPAVRRKKMIAVRITALIVAPE